MIKRYQVRNLHCGGCAARIEEALLRVPGVVSASIDLSSARLRLEGEEAALADPVPLSRIADAIEPGAAFAPLVEASACASCACCDTCAAGPDAEEASPRREGFVLGLSALLFGLGLVAGPRLEPFLPSRGVDMLFFGLPYLLCGLPVLRQGLRSLLRRDFFNEFTLMGIATLAAIAIGELPEAVGVMLFYRIGEAVQERAAGSSRRSVKALLAARPSVAHLLDAQGALRDADPRDVLPGARLLVKPGEKIPLDGVVREGRSQVDTSPLTGEPVPVTVASGERVFAGTVNLGGALTVETDSEFKDSSVARILDLVERATAAKAPTERLITRFARVYTPAVVVVAALVAALPPLLGHGTFSEWLYRALVLLVVSCPCALVISIPLGYFGGIGAASRRGILVKGGQVIDALRHIRAVALDKTGTLTRGVFDVAALLPAPGVAEADLLRAAALAESRSTHPIARSIAAAAAALPDAPAGHVPVSTVEEVPGKGLIARIGGKDGARLLVGSAELLAGHGVETALPAASGNTARHGAAGSVVHVARNETYLGAIVVADIVRPESAGAVRALHRLGIRRVIMLTGDRPRAAQAVAAELKLDGFEAGLLPEDKAAALEKLGPAQETLFVGDGINDAPVLAAAGVGVAMGGLGSEAAIEVADAVILDDSPARLPELLRIAAKTRAIVRENIILALGIKSAFMVLGVAGLSGLWEAVFADVGVALLAVLNASRAMRG